MTSSRVCGLRDRKDLSRGLLIDFSGTSCSSLSLATSHVLRPISAIDSPPFPAYVDLYLQCVVLFKPAVVAGLDAGCEAFGLSGFRGCSRRMAWLHLGSFISVVRAISWVSLHLYSASLKFCQTSVDVTWMTAKNVNRMVKVSYDDMITQRWVRSGKNAAAAAAAAANELGNYNARIYF